MTNTLLKYKALLVYPLALYILLLSICNQLYLHTYQKSTSSHALVKNLDVAKTDAPTGKHTAAFVSKTADNAKGNNQLILSVVEYEEEDKKSNTSKKVKSSNHFTALFHFILPDYFFSQIKGSFFFKKDALALPSFKSLFIRFCVYRL